ncbi:MAG: hypothetical protein RL141_99 [Candidatus Parcubacteria bacterium]|jgi:regulator of protease activity HflC (stomatin/prohibitin superfamily)
MTFPIKHSGLRIVLGIVCFVILFVIVNPLVIIAAGERGVVLTWGAVNDTPLESGIHWRMPIAQTVRKIDVRIQKDEVQASAASKDLQTVKATVALNYHLDPALVAFLYKEVGIGYAEKVISPAIQEAVKAATAQYTAEELITKRETVKETIRASLAERLKGHHILVDDFSVINFDFSESFNESIEAKVTAEQNALAAKNKLEQVKFEAEQRVTQAKAEAEAIKIQAEAITQQGGQSYVDLQAIEKWNGVLPSQMIPNATLPFINLTR